MFNGTKIYIGAPNGGNNCCVVIGEAGTILCNSGDGFFKSIGYLSRFDKARMRGATWSPPLPQEVTAAIQDK